MVIVERLRIQVSRPALTHNEAKMEHRLEDVQLLYVDIEQNVPDVSEKRNFKRQLVVLTVL